MAPAILAAKSLALLLPEIALPVAVAGSVYSGVAGYQQAKTAEAMAEYNAELQEQEAKTIEAKTEFEQNRQARAAARKMGELAAGLGASGAVPSVGSPLLIKAKQASELELENLMIGYEGQIGVSRALSQAALDKMQAGIYRKRATSSLISGFTGAAGTTLLTGFNR